MAGLRQVLKCGLENWLDYSGSIGLSVGSGGWVAGIHDSGALQRLMEWRFGFSLGFVRGGWLWPSESEYSPSTYREKS